MDCYSKIGYCRSSGKPAKYIFNPAKYIFILPAITAVFLSLTVLCACGSRDYESLQTELAQTAPQTEESISDVTEAAEAETTTEEPQNYYVSSSDEFTSYSFICPDGWTLFETGNGRRVVIENPSNSESSGESIYIFVVDKNETGELKTPDAIISNYTGTALKDANTEVLEEEILTAQEGSYGSDFVLNGYVYESSLEKDSSEKAGKESEDQSGDESEAQSGMEPDKIPGCVDYFTYIENEKDIYCIKYIGLKKDRESAEAVFKKFLSSFAVGAEKDKVKEKDENSKVNILILGDDSGMGRPGGRVNGRTDIIIILHLNLDTCKGTAVTIPRDTWVNIPGHGDGKINGAHATVGNELTVKAVEQLSGLKIDNYIITDFDGFIPLIDFLGGVTVEIGENLNDGFSGCYLTKGVHHLDGTQALALSRNRHRAGDGTTQGGAFAREKEAAKIIVALLDQKSTFERIMAMPLFINFLLKYTWTDLRFTDIIRLLPVLGKIKASDIEITGIPSWPQMVGNASAVVYDEEATAELFEEVKNQ
ncbi:MAG: LytR family transcriptional regulator [Actinobacteria bacterium]|nr:LytR family transcriptional regulator [Actinomycetota bacterium]